MYGGPTSNLGAQQASGRTESMLLMSVTLDVSKLSGWLNAEICRVTQEARGRVGAVPVRAACMEDQTGQGGNGTRGWRT